MKLIKTKFKKAQLFIISTIIISLSFLYITFQISKLSELKILEEQLNYLTYLNYVNKLLEDSYNNHLIEWYYLDCKYRKKVLVINPTIEGFRIMKIKSLLSQDEISNLNINLENIRLVDQYNKKLSFKTVMESGNLSVIISDYLDSYSSKVYYIYFNCEFKDPQDPSLYEFTQNNLNKYYYQIFNIEFRDLFERSFAPLSIQSLQKQAFSLIYFKNKYNISFENFSNQSDWIYYQKLYLS